MKMTRMLSVACFATAFAALADVQALYWQVTEEQNVNNVSFDYAALVATDNNNATHYFADVDGGTFESSTSGRKSTELIMTSIGSTYQTGWSFFIELWNYSSTDSSWSRAGKSYQTYSYNDLQSYIHSISDMSLSALSTFTPAVVVPEPSSGLLLLVGGALLALRRRRS